MTVSPLRPLPCPQIPMEELILPAPVVQGAQITRCILISKRKRTGEICEEPKKLKQEPSILLTPLITGIAHLSITADKVSQISSRSLGEFQL